MLALITGFAILVWLPIIIDSDPEPDDRDLSPSEARDQNHYHMPVVQTMVDQWPAIDIVDYRSATAPGYHLFLAAVGKAGLNSELALRLAGSLGGLLLIGATWWFVARSVGPVPALAIIAPLMGCSYVLGASIWMTTDAMALGFVATCLGLSMMALTPSRWHATYLLTFAGLAATAAVGVRQIHIWVAATPWIAAALCLTRTALAESDRSPSLTIRQLAIITPVLLLPFGLLLWFAVLWGGLTPPIYRDLHDAGANPANLSLALATTGMFGAFFLPSLRDPSLPEGSQGFDRWFDTFHPQRAAWIGGALAAGLAALPLSSVNEDAGRIFGTVWRLIDLAPVVADRSPVMILLAGAGGMVIGQFVQHLWQQADRRPAIVLALSVLGWIAAQSMNSQAWQRYIEPPVLLFLIWAAALSQAPSTSPSKSPTRSSNGSSIAPDEHSPHHVPDGLGSRTSIGRWWIGPMLLGILLLAFSVLAVYREL